MNIIIANDEIEKLFLLSPCSESYVVDSDTSETTDVPSSDDSDEVAA